MQQLWLIIKTTILSLVTVLKPGGPPTPTVTPIPTVVEVRYATPTPTSIPTPATMSISENLYQAGKEAMKFWCGKKVTTSNILKLTQEYQQIFFSRGFTSADIKKFITAVTGDVALSARLTSELGTTCSVNLTLPRIK